MGDTLPTYVSQYLYYFRETMSYRRYRHRATSLFGKGCPIAERINKKGKKGGRICNN